MRIGVLMGGTSDERDVSLASGTQVSGALRAAGHHVVSVDTVRGIMTLEEEANLVSAGVGQLPPEPIALLASENERFVNICLLYTSPSPRDATLSRMPSSA